VSPSLWWADGRVLDDFEMKQAGCGGRVFWLDMGNTRGLPPRHVTPSIRSTRRLAACFDAAGLVPGRDYLSGSGGRRA